MQETMEILQSEFLTSCLDTAKMMVITMLACLVLGTLLGLILHLTSSPMFFPNRVLNTIAGTIVNIIRSLPFIILLIILIPFTRLVAGTNVGATAASVPLAIAAVPFYARLVEGAFSEVDKGVVEAAFATGASIPLIIRKVLFVEAMPGLIRGFTVTFVSVIGYTAMAGIVGGGGIGDLAMKYGYYRYQSGVMWVAAAVLVLIVQVGQWLGDKCALKFTKK